MKRDMSKQENLKEEVLTDVVKVNNAPEIDEKPPVEVPQHALDDARRVKVLSPARLVAKRFFRNKLAIVGLVVLIFMFAFSFLGVLFSPYGETEMFTTDKVMLYPYASANYRTSYPTYSTEGSPSVNMLVKSRINTFISEMKEEDKTSLAIAGESADEEYVLYEKKDGTVYILQKRSIETVVTIFSSSYTFVDSSLDTQGFRDALAPNLATKTPFVYDNRSFIIESRLSSYTIKERLPLTNALVITNLIFNSVVAGEAVSDSFVFAFGLAFDDTNAFTYNGVDYTITDGENEGSFVVNKNENGQVTPSFYSDNFVLRSMSGNDDFSIEFKSAMREKIEEIIANPGQTELVFNHSMMLDVPIYEDILDEEGVIIGEEIVGYEKVYEEDAEFVINRKDNEFTIQNYQTRRVFDVYAAPSAKHWLGTDGVAMDALTRLMCGGRVSLLIGFIVVIIEVLLGVIMGGLAGYFGKWVDNLIMRLVDIFNCIPFLPILIIIGTVFDKIQLSPILRIIWLMAILGFMGWSGVARLVRGQILSLREQEFMIAAEATGLKTKRRIFKHLIPNVMPQLIVLATMGLGGVILTESTLSYLGLGAKFPMSTWGSMIGSVSSAFALKNYVNIWLPVGLAICLTVIAFNFVGDGLRDALDPKMKR